MAGYECMSDALTTSDIDLAARRFSRSMLVSGVRCMLTYVVFPWLLPALGWASGVGPWIGLPIGLLAIGFIGAGALIGQGVIHARAGDRTVTVRGLSDVNIGKLRPRQDLWVELFRPSDGKMARFPVRCRIDNQTEMDYLLAGGVMPYVLRNLARGPETEAPIAAE